MIESVDIENLRGIREGKVEGLTPLTVLTGPNGNGKSTVLDDPGIARELDVRMKALGVSALLASL